MDLSSSNEAESAGDGPWGQVAAFAGDAIYAVGDVHGCAGELRVLLAAILADAQTLGAAAPVLVFLGDLVDRGPDSRTVLDLACAGLPGFRTLVVQGNHDRMLRDFVLDGDRGSQADWLHNGAEATLRSYGLDGAAGRLGAGAFARDMDTWRRSLRARMPAAHLRLLDESPTLALSERLVLAHARIDPFRPLNRQFEEDLLWGRWRRTAFGAEEVLAADIGGRCFVHGHDITGPIPTRHGDRVAVDTGAFLSGTLSCAAFDPSGSLRFFLADSNAARVVAAGATPSRAAGAGATG